MKKILFVLLAAVTFTACGSDDPVNPDPSTSFDNWNDPKSTHYFDGKYNPIEGEWQLTQRNGASPDDFLIYRFSNSFTLSKATAEPAEDKHPSYTDSKAYQINDKAYKIGDTQYSYATSGTLESATLTIKEGNNTLTFAPYVSKVWSWKGDWNNPNDPHYAIYNGKYNPIKGTWHITHESGRPVNSYYYSFDDNFEWKQAYVPNTNTLVGKYIINDTGIRNTSKNASYKYTIKNNTLTLIGTSPNTAGVNLVLSKYN